MKGKHLFNGKIPPFVNTDITHEAWITMKNETTDLNDVYIDTIKKLYREKGCYHIQISEK